MTSSSDLVGRTAMLSALRALVGRAAAGEAGLVVLTGPAGAGRTAVLDALAAAHDGPVRRARGASWESGCHHGVLAQLLGGRAPDGDAFAAAKEVVHDLGHTGAADGADATAGPSVLLVDDAHLADVASLQALDTAVAHHPSVPLLVVLAVRAAEVPPDRAEVLGRARRTVHVGPLGGPEIAELATARGLALPELTVERLRRHTGGVARQVLALLDEVPDWDDPYLRLPPPAAVAAWVDERLATLSPAARAVAEAVAVLGGPAELHEVGALARVGTSGSPQAGEPVPPGGSGPTREPGGGPEPGEGTAGGPQEPGDGPADAVFGPLDEAARAGLVVRAGGRRGPMAVAPNPMVRAAVLDRMGPEHAARTRLRAADVVEAPVRALRYRAAATPGRDADLADRLETQAAAAAADGVWSAVADLLADAARLTADRALREDRRTRSVDAQVGAGDVLGARAMIPELANHRETARQGAVLGYLAINLGHQAEAGARLARAWSLATSGDPDRGTAALVAQRHVLHALAGCRGEDLIAWTDRVADLAEPGSPAAIEASVIRGLGLAAAGRTVEAAREYRRVAASVPHGPQVQRVTMGRGWLGVVTDDVDESRLALEGATETTELGGSARISLWALGWLARARFLCGEWDRALSAVDRGRALAARTGIVLATPLLEWTAAGVHTLRDEPDRAEDAVRRSESGPLDYAVMRVPALLARAQIAEAAADWERVLRVLEPLVGIGGGVDEPGWWPWTDVYAGALVMTGRIDEADAFLVPHERRAADRGHRSTQARLGSARGRLHGARGEVDEARTAFGTALGLLDGSPLRYDRARVGFAAGQTLRRAGKRREADALLAAARDGFAALGASAYVARCDRELRAGGVLRAGGQDTGGRDTDAAGRSDLTPQERAVTDLVSRGLSNREVAAQLHVSHKTVQYHLTRIYAKLGVRSRSELAALAVDHGTGSLAPN